ncbi:DUF2778 domain-containing protein [Limnobacter sp.]|uniref:DUF2778 domain-containing protein n=1 Tax=Limnobacter sp. TaxID=2003368 RepID=UPI0035177691
MECSFRLNGLPMSAVKYAHLEFPAFSGLGSHVNKSNYTCHKNVGAIPIGYYYIVDRSSGGWLGEIRDLFSSKSEWFALYALDGKIDDEVFCNSVARGQFRMHPKGSLGRSEGCIVLANERDFQSLSVLIRKHPPVAVPNTKFLAYGVLSVIA